MIFDSVKALAALKLPVIRLAYNGKVPVDEGFPSLATYDIEKLRSRWFDPILEIEQPYNVGFSTNGFIGIDIDNKNGKNGSEELIKLEAQGLFFPSTYEQSTPTGGTHLVYRSKLPIKNSAGFLAPGIDVRGVGGYLVGAGSEINGKRYTANGRPPIDAPDWMYEKLTQVKPKPFAPRASVTLRQDSAVKRAIHYLTTEAPVSLQGQNGDQTAYRVAARLKDFGVDQLTAHELLLDYWNDRAEPPWDPRELAEKVDHAWRYGTQQIGVAAPETDFSPLPTDPIRGTGQIVQSSLSSPSPDRHPFEKLNENFAFVIAGAGHHILWERKDAHGKDEVVHIPELTFHKKFAARSMLIESKVTPITELWMRHELRRSYDGFCFCPGRPSPEGYYNLFRGFAIQPALPDEKYPPEAHEAVSAFMEHILANVCLNDAALSKWLVGYFAHVFQRPWERPDVALVFRGRKGVGKSFVFETIGELLGSHSLVAADRRYLTGNFNSHLERLLFITLEEAFWSGDKLAEGILKNLITGRTHVIEHKGKEPYSVDNCIRVGIIGNEDWLVPASEDERRFAVFDVGDGQKQNRTFFQSIRNGMENGGYRILLRHFLDLDISTIAVGEAPKTKGLADQKINSLNTFYQWWFECLTDGAIVGNSWLLEIPKDVFRDSFARYLRRRHITNWAPTDVAVGRYISQCAKSVSGKGRMQEGNERVNSYLLPDLETARAEWEAFMESPVEWND